LIRIRLQTCSVYCLTTDLKHQLRKRSAGKKKQKKEVKAEKAAKTEKKESDKESKESKGSKKDKGSKKADKVDKADKADKAEKAQTKPLFLKYGINHIARLVESKKAKLVIIAHDVDPIELVVWLPALCRKLDVPFCVVKSKARLGQLVNKKTASSIAVTDVRKEDVNKLDQILAVVKPAFNDNANDTKKWGGSIMGAKTQAVLRKREKATQREKNKALQN